MTVGDSNDKPAILEVTDWEETPQSIEGLELPLNLHVTIGREPAIVYLTTAYVSSEPVFLKLVSSSFVRFTEQGIELNGNHMQIPGLQLPFVITVGPLQVAVPLLKTCDHGFAPPSLCSKCGYPVIDTH